MAPIAPYINKLLPYHRWRMAYTPVIPNFYWDAVSPEQQLLELCRQWDAIIKYEELQTEEINEVVRQVNEMLASFDDKLNADVIEEVNKLVQSGKFDEYVQQAVDYWATHKAYEVADGRIPSFRRIGRKMIFDKLGSVQGSCVNGDDFVYIRWNGDNVNDENELVKINIETGTVLATKQFNFGWCNSVAWDGIYYVIVVRGNHEGNNDLIVRYDDEFNYVDSINMGYNVNAIYFHDDKYYVVPEDNWDVLVYDEITAESQPVDSIILQAEKLYTQNIMVTDENIYILSSRPNCILQFDKSGVLQTCYDIPFYADGYQFGESQALLMHEGQMIITSDMIPASYSRFNIAWTQFFYIDLTGKKPITNTQKENVVTYYCDSENDVYNPDGSTTKPFYHPVEAMFTDDNNGKVYPFVNGQNKEYASFAAYNWRGKLTTMTIESIRIEYCYDLFLENVNIQNGDNFIRDANITFAGGSVGDGEFGLDLERNATVKLSGITFGTYEKRALKIQPGCKVDNTAEDVQILMTRSNTPMMLYNGPTLRNVGATGTMLGEARAICEWCRCFDIELAYDQAQHVVRCYRSADSYELNPTVTTIRSNRIEVLQIKVVLNPTDGTFQITQARLWDSLSGNVDNNPTFATFRITAYSRW